MGAAFYVLFGALFAIAVSLAAGRWMLRRWAPPLAREEEWPLAFVTGAAALSLTVFLLFAAQLAYKGVFLALGLGVLAAAWRSGALRPVERRMTPLPRIERYVFAAGFTVFTALYFFTAMAPECSPDGASYHLGLMARYLRHHGFEAVPYNMYAQLSEGVEMLFAFAFAFGRHSAGALVHYAFFVALAFLLLAFGRRIGHPAVGVAAALFFYTAPVTGMDGTSAYIDVAVAAILFAGFYLLELSDEHPAASTLCLIGLLAGFAFAAKYTAFLAVPYAAGRVFWRQRRLRPAFIVVAASLVSIVPWVSKNLVITGNPVAPMMNAWFPNHFVHPSFERDWSRQMRTYGVSSWREIPWEITVRGEKLSGHLGPVFLLLPLALLALRKPVGRRLLIPAALYTLAWFGNIGARFLIPALPFWSLTIALAFAAWPRALAAMSALACVLCWPSLMRLYAGQYLWALEARFPVPAALRIESEDSWLGRKHGEYVITRVIEAKTPPGARIFSFGGWPEAYTTREIAVSFQSARGEVLADTFTGAFSADVQTRLRQSLTFSPRNARRLRIIQTAAAKQPSEEWLINEVRLFSQGREIPRSREWRITSLRNPWDIQLAFDNSPITRWRSWDSMRNGDFVEIDLFRPTALDEIALETSASQRIAALRLEIDDGSGRWTAVDPKRTDTNATPPGFQGKAAMAEFKAAGFDYLILQPEDWGGKEVLEDPAAWGLTEVGRAGKTALYRIDVEGPLLVER